MSNAAHSGPASGRPPSKGQGQHPSIAGPAIEVVDYRFGSDGYQSVDNYDKTRYETSAGRYKRMVMAAAYNRLIGPLEGRRVLDVGCGTGRGVLDFSSRARMAVGVDASTDMLAVASRKRIDASRCAFAGSIAQVLPFPDATFDVVTSLNFLHLFSVDAQRQMVSEMKRVTRPGGTLVVEFDNALHGLAVGLYKRWRHTEIGSLPGEIQRVVGGSCRVERVYGAVCPILWRLFFRVPRLFSEIEKLEYFPPLNRLAHRIYYKLVKEG